MVMRFIEQRLGGLAWVTALTWREAASSAATRRKQGVVDKASQTASHPRSDCAGLAGALWN